MRFENIYKETDENMRLALLSLWAPGNHPMRPAIEDLFNRGLCLPSDNKMTDEQQDAIIEIIKSCFD